MTAPIFMPTPAAPVRWPRKPAAWFTIAVARSLVMLRPHRLRAALELLRTGARPATVAETRRALDAVLASSVRCRGEYCLQRSVATALLCRLSGSWPELRVGARPQPFQAHAWLSVDGVAVGEMPEVIRGLGTLMVVAAREDPDVVARVDGYPTGDRR